MNDRAKYLAVDEEKNNRIQHIRECFSIIYDEIDLKCKPSSFRIVIFVIVIKLKFISSRRFVVESSNNNAILLPLQKLHCIFIII